MFYIASRERQRITEDWLNSNYSNIKKEVSYTGIFGPFTLEEAVAKYYNGFFDDCDYGVFILKDKHWYRIRWDIRKKPDEGLDPHEPIVYEIYKIYKEEIKE